MQRDKQETCSYDVALQGLKHMWRDISRFGKKLVDRGLVESQSGNISVRTGSKLFITRRGAMLDEISEDSIVEVDLNPMPGSAPDPTASSECNVHRAIYDNTSALAIIHAHCPFAVVMSFLCGAGGVNDNRKAGADGGVSSNSIIPVDIEGQYFLPEILVVGGGSGTAELGENLGLVLSKVDGAIVQGHGTFAVGGTLEEAYVVTTRIEHSCKVRYYLDLMGKSGNRR